QLLRIVSNAVKEMSEGELLQQEKSRLLNITEEVYYEIIRQKTASLIAACCESGAVAAGASEVDTKTMYDFGLNVGLAFQIKDDLLDYGFGEKIGKPIDDLLAGPFQQLNTQLQQLRKGGSAAWMATGAADGALAATDQILVGLAEVLKNLVDIQDFNELLEMVRGMVDEQKELLDATKKEQKKRVLDLFK
ncbi:MAG: polyprenyl synthetase family protein, partial [Pirellulaceae bacterium]